MQALVTCTQHIAQHTTTCTLTYTGLAECVVLSIMVVTLGVLAVSWLCHLSAVPLHAIMRGGDL